MFCDFDLLREEITKEIDEFNFEHISGVRLIRQGLLFWTI